MELFAVIVATILLGVFGRWFLWGREKGKLPPGPYGFPIVGNIFQIGKHPHASLAEMSKKHGPLMSIRLGSALNVVVSSPELAKEVLTMEAFTGRKHFQVSRVLDHHIFSVVFMPTTSRKWKYIRKVMKEEMLSHQRLEATQSLRQGHLQQLVDYVAKSCGGGAVNIRNAIFTATLNLMTTTLFSNQDFQVDADQTRQLKEAITDLTTVARLPNLEDLFPILARFDPVSAKRRAEVVLTRMLRIVQTHIDQRVEWKGANPDAPPKTTDFLQTLIDGDGQLSFDDIRHSLVAVYVAGPEPTMALVEWVMTQLLLHPEKLRKATSEVRAVMGGRKTIEGSDISRLPYLQAVIKEVLRLHPPSPIFPRRAEEDTTIGGYFIPKHTPIILNLWAIGRDPTLWPDPQSFQPERFLGDNVSIDYKGVHSQLLPFGAGRRICPGLSLAHRLIHETVAALIGNFDWEFPADDADKHRNAESFEGFSLVREVPLKAVPLLKP